jgi:O-antigen biosynthesis protein WbqP
VVSLYRKAGKRTLDLLLSGSALVVSSPLTLAVALAIHLDDGAPVFFRQERVGRHGELFTLWKFRSMRLDAPALASAEASDSVVTPVGRVLRRTNIDELPQLLNVLRGDMSIVGPRAPLASQEKLIRLREEGGATELRPGLTGLAQVNAYDGMDDASKAAFDVDYARRVSLRLDLALIGRTFGYLRKPPPKY